MPSSTTFALFNKRASARECRKRLNYLLLLAQPLYKRSKNALGRAGRERWNLSGVYSIVSQLVDLTHSLCYWNTTRGALRLCIWLRDSKGWDLKSYQLFDLSLLRTRYYVFGTKCILLILNFTFSVSKSTFFDFPSKIDFLTKNRCWGRLFWN
jgi:hypothetical protein